MQARKKLVLATFGIFLAGLVIAGGLARVRQTPKAILFSSISNPVIGAEQARIEMVLFEDLACPACRRFIQEIFPQIKTAYIEPGIAKLVLIPVILYEESRMMANALLEVYAQAPNQVASFLEKLILKFGNREPSAKDLIDLAKELGNIRLTDFTKSIETGRYDQQLDANLRLAKKVMKTQIKTPALFINGFPIHPLVFETISMQIERILDKERLSR